MKKGYALKTCASICVLALMGMLIAGCLKVVFEDRTPMYDLSVVKAHFSAFGGAYLAVLIALIAVCLLAGFIKRQPEKRKKPDEYKRAKAIKKRTETAARVGAVVFALLMIVFGIINGGLYDVFVKAVNICTECIGLG